MRSSTPLTQRMPLLNAFQLPIATPIPSINAIARPMVLPRYVHLISIFVVLGFNAI